MSRDSRPEPDDLLRRVQSDEARKCGGRLRLFLGMSAGVGKTYAMLQAAHQQQREGVDVVVGVVETHNRAETMKLTEGLAVIARRQTEYRGATLDEMDLDAVVERRPKLVLVDELAHTNAPGSRHEKRYQDVIELLDRGIDVYSTLNVQHLESRKESVESIAQITIRETVPDSILERAHLVQVVDIAPSELLKRLSEGKIYAPDKAKRASEGFFREDRLTALREIALRLTAERVDQDLSRLVTTDRTGPWSTNERLMVAVSHSPHSERLIRATRRIAYNLEAPWIATHVDSGGLLNTEDQRQLRHNINLARELGAEVVTTSEVDVAHALQRVAYDKNVTQIVMGRAPRRPVFDTLRGGTVLDRLITRTREVDIHVIRSPSGDVGRKLRLFTYDREAFGTFLNYWYAFWAIMATGLVGALVESFIGYRAVGFLFLLGVLMVGLASSIGPVMFAATLSAVGWNFFFIPPRLNFNVGRPDDLILCASYLIVALIVGFLTNRVRSHERLIRDREDRTNTLFQIAQDIASSGDKDEFLSRVVTRIGRVLHGSAGVLLRGRDEQLRPETGKPYSLPLSEKEFAVANWCYGQGRAAGWSTETLGQAKGLYLPLKTNAGMVGVLVFVPESGRNLTIEQETLLMSITGQLAVSLDRHFFQKRLQESARLEESEKLHQALRQSIATDVSEPLRVILASAKALNAPALSAAGTKLEQVLKGFLSEGVS